MEFKPLDIQTAGDKRYYKCEDVLEALGYSKTYHSLIGDLEYSDSFPFEWFEVQGKRKGFKYIEHNSLLEALTLLGIKRHTKAFKQHFLEVYCKNYTKPKNEKDVNSKLDRVTKVIKNISEEAGQNGITINIKELKIILEEK